MRKLWTRMIGLFMVVSLMAGFCLPVFAASDAEENAANALNRLGLFLGTNLGYELDSNLNREQAITMVVRLLGAEEEAMEANFPHPFKDVSSWADPYVGYAYAKRITNGVGDTKFGAADKVTEEQYLTFLLRILKYEENVDFTWKNPYDAARKAGLVASGEKEQDACLRGDAVVFSWRFLNQTPKGSKMTVAEDLIDQGVFTKAAFEEATKLAGGQNVSTEAKNPEISGSDDSSEGGTEGGGTEGGDTEDGDTEDGDTEDGDTEDDNDTDVDVDDGENDTEDVPVEFA